MNYIITQLTSARNPAISNEQSTEIEGLEKRKKLPKNTVKIVTVQFFTLQS